jgi:hypothetical protein
MAGRSRNWWAGSGRGQNALIVACVFSIGAGSFEAVPGPAMVSPDCFEMAMVV